MKANIIVEQNSEGYFSCYVEEEIPYIGLQGYGETSQEAIDSLIAFYNESKLELAKEGKHLPELEFVVHYDMPSFFNRFNYLNISKVAEKAGINPSLMRRYAAGITTAGQSQYDKLQHAVNCICAELMSATF